MKYLITIFLYLGLTNLQAQQPYPHLKTFEIENSYCGEKPFRIHYEQTLGEIINTKRNEFPRDHKLFLSDEMGEDDIIVLKLKFTSAKLKGEYYLEFSFGPSCDPGFNILDATTLETIGRTHGMEIYIPGGNSVYTTGHINTTFNKRRKYTFSKSTFEEVQPEFYYVGLKSKTLKPITLFTGEDLTTQLAYLPKDYNVEVVAAKRTSDYPSKIKYLIKTELGLLGWSTIEVTAFESLQIEGIMFLGD